MKNLLFIIFTLMLFSPINSYAQDEVKRISVQGFLKDGNGKAVEDGQYEITFIIYDAPTGGTALWQGIETFTVFGGVYSAQIGEGTLPPNNTQELLLDAIAWDKPYYLGIKVQGIELSPRTALTYSPYAFSVNKSSEAHLAQVVKCSGAVGDIKYSILNPTEFAEVNGSCWVPMDGQTSVWQTELGSHLQDMGNYTYTSNSKVPNVSGAFLRAHEYGSGHDYSRTSNSPIASLQNDAIDTHTHGMNFTSGNGGLHNHSYSDAYLNRVQMRGDNGAASIDDTWARGGESAWMEGYYMTGNEGDQIGFYSTTTSHNTNQSGNHNHSINGNTNSTSGATVSEETRPTNFNFYAYIRIN